METLNNILACLFFLSFIAFILGMIKPSLLKLQNRKKAVIVTVSAMVISLILFAVTQTDEQLAQIKANELAQIKAEEKAKLQAKLEVKAEENAKAAKEKADAKLQASILAEENKRSLGITAEQFRQQLNAKLKTIDISDLRPLAEFSINNDAGKKTFSEKINSGITVFGTLNNSNNLTSVSIIYDVENANTEINANLYLILTGSIIQIISKDTDLPKKVVSLLNKAAENPSISKEDNSKVINNIQYSTTVKKGTGFIFLIEYAD